MKEIERLTRELAEARELIAHAIGGEHPPALADHYLRALRRVMERTAGLRDDDATAIARDAINFPPHSSELPRNVTRYKVQQDQGEYALKGCDDGDLVDWTAYAALLSEYERVNRKCAALAFLQYGAPKAGG